MLIHMFFAEIFVVLLVFFNPPVTTSLFTHFFVFIALAMLSMGLALWGMYSYYYKWDRYSVLNKKRHIALGFTMGLFIWIWMVFMTGIDTYMVTGGPGVKPLSGQTVESFGTAVRGIFNPMFTEMVLHRTFANLSWPAFAIAAWASYRYIRSKTIEEKAFFDWSSSVGLTWGVGFLLLQPLVGFAMLYSLKVSRPENPASSAATGGSYERLTSGETSNLLVMNLILVVLLVVLANAAMYFGSERHPDQAGQIPIRFFGLVAAVAGVFWDSPPPGVPLPFMRYLAAPVLGSAS